MLVTLSGIVTEEREEQPENVSYPMLVTLLPIVTEAREVQLKNAPPPRMVTLSGIVTETREVQLENAYVPMVFTLSRSVRCLSNFLPWNDWPIDVMPRVRDSSAPHPRNTFVEILFTPFPIVTDEREEQL